MSKKVRTAGNTCHPFQNNTSYKILNIIIANNWFSCVLFYSFIYFFFITSLRLVVIGPINTECEALQEECNIY